MFIPHHVSHVTCHMPGDMCHVSCVRCLVSGVKCHFFFLFFFSFLFLSTKWWSLSREGLLSTGPTPSSSLIYWLSRWSFSSKSSQHHKSLTVRARKLKFWEKSTYYLGLCACLSYQAPTLKTPWWAKINYLRPMSSALVCKHLLYKALQVP